MLSHGELGHGSLEFEIKPKAIEFFVENEIKATLIGAGAWHSVVVTESGDAYVFGWNKNNAIGLDDVR